MLNVVHTSLQVSFETERQMGKRVAKIAHKITDTTMWNELYSHPWLKKLAALTHTKDLDDTLLAVTHHFQTNHHR